MPFSDSLHDRIMFFCRGNTTALMLKITSLCPRDGRSGVREQALNHKHSSLCRLIDDHALEITGWIEKISRATVWMRKQLVQ